MQKISHSFEKTMQKVPSAINFDSKSVSLKYFCNFFQHSFFALGLLLMRLLNCRDTLLNREIVAPFLLKIACCTAYKWNLIGRFKNVGLIAAFLTKLIACFKKVYAIEGCI